MESFKFLQCNTLDDKDILKMTTGKVGAFFVGDEQIGGFFDWSLTINLASGIDGNFRTHRVASWSAIANAYWFERKLYDVEARFFSDATDHYWSGKVKLGLYRFRTNVFIKEPLEFHGNGVLEVKSWLRS